MGLVIFADGQTLYEPLPEVVFVFRQHGFQGIFQKLQVLFQFGEVTFGGGNESFFLHTEGIFVPVEGVVLAEVFCIGVVGKRLMVLAGVVCFIWLWSLPFAERSTKPLFLAALRPLPIPPC